MIILSLLLAADPPAPVAVEPSSVAEERPAPERAEGPGSRFGIVGYAAGKGSVASGFGLLAGLGMRVGLRERTADELMFMPALALVGGIVWDPRGVQPWLEQRFELMAARYGGVLQPAFHGFVSTGVLFRAVDRGPPARLPLSGTEEPWAARPYLGLGVGWNWLPKGGGGGGGAGLGGGWGGGLGGGSGAAAIVALAVAAVAVITFVFAGRVEVRMMPGLRSDEPVEVAVMVGAGF